MMYAPAGSVIDFVPRFHEFMTETLYVSSELQYCFPRSLFYLHIFEWEKMRRENEKMIGKEGEK